MVLQSTRVPGRFPEAGLARSLYRALLLLTPRQASCCRYGGSAASWNSYQAVPRIQAAATVVCEGGPGLVLHLASRNPEAPDDVGLKDQARDQCATNLLFRIAEMRSLCAAPALSGRSQRASRRGPRTSMAAR